MGAGWSCSFPGTWDINHRVKGVQGSSLAIYHVSLPMKCPRVNSGNSILTEEEWVEELMGEGFLIRVLYGKDWPERSGVKRSILAAGGKEMQACGERWEEWRTEDFNTADLGGEGVSYDCFFLSAGLNLVLPTHQTSTKPVRRRSYVSYCSCSTHMHLEVKALSWKCRYRWAETSKLRRQGLPTEGTSQHLLLHGTWCSSHPTSTSRL